MATSPEKQIENALVTAISALSYPATNSISVRNHDDMTKEKAASFINVQCNKAGKDWGYNFNFYRSSVEIACVTHVANDESAAVAENLYDSVNNYVQDLTVSALNTAVTNAKITIDGIVPTQNEDDYNDEMRVHVVRFDCMYTYNTVIAPVNSVAPVASGTGEVGQTLSTTNGTWLYDPVSYGYQWQSDGVNITSATSSTYLLASAQGGTDVRCVVTATNTAGSTAANSNAISVAAEANYFLDTYTTAFDAWEIARLTKTGQTQIALVRESGGGTEAWIGADGSGDLDETALLAHTGANNGFVKTLMGGNDNAATQTTAGNQPQIVTAGVVEKLNGKPTLIKQSNSTILETSAITATQPNTMFTVGRMDSGDTRVMFGGSGANRNQLYLTSGNVTMLAGATIAQTGGASAQHLWTTLFNTTSSVLREDGSQTASGDVGSWNPDKVTLMNFGAGGNAANNFQAHVLFNSDQTANFAAIETFFNDYYGIYV
jgi:hypothetical protein